MPAKRPKKIVSISPGFEDVMENFNALVDQVNSLQNILGAYPVQVTTAGGETSISLGEEIPEIDFMELTGEVDVNNTDGEADYVLYNHTNNKYEKNTDGIGEKSIACTMTAPHLEKERHATLKQNEHRKLALLPFTYWHIAVLEQDLPAGGSANATIYDTTNSASGLAQIQVKQFFLNWGLIPSGRRVMIIQHRESLEWYVINADCEPEV